MRQAGKAELASALIALRNKTLASFEHITPSRERVPQLAIVNLPIWELGHVGWVQEHWCLRYENGRCARNSILQNADRQLDSAWVDHAWRWNMILPPSEQIHSYLAQVLEKSLIALESCDQTDESLYFHRLCYFHEVMHLEAFFYTWQTLGFPKPAQLPEPGLLVEADSPRLSVPAGLAILGSEPGDGFVFDNEKWAQEVALEGFEIDAHPVTYQRFAQFVTDGGYQNRRFWSPTGWEQIQARGSGLPEYWRHTGGSPGKFDVRWFDRWIDLPAQRAMMHVSAFEAEAFCRWAGCQLPTESQWTLAAQTHAGLNWGRHVWEWTASAFNPLPGFSPDPYKEYSQPWFGDHAVVKGGSFATEPALVDWRFRNFYLPARNDLFVGFRTCQSGD